MKSCFLVLLLTWIASHGASIEGASFELVHSKLELTKVTVTGVSGVGEETRPFRPASISYHSTMGDAAIVVTEGAVNLLSPASEEFENLLSERYSDAQSSMHAFIFHEKKGWTAVLIVGAPVQENRNITQGLYVSVEAPSQRSVLNVLDELSKSLVVYTGHPIGPKKFSDQSFAPMMTAVAVRLRSEAPNKIP